MGVATVVLVYDLTRRLFGRAGRLRRRPRARGHADHGRDLAPQQPRRAARAVLRRGAVVRRARAPGRAHALDRARRRRASGSASRRRWSSRCSSSPGSSRRGCGSRRAAALRAAAPAARRRRRDGRRRRRLAAADGAHARPARPPVDLGHERQQHPVADLRLQRPRPRRRPGRRAGRSPAAAAAAARSAAPRARCGCSTSALGGQAGWLLGFALVAASGSSWRTRLRRATRARGWLLAVGGAFVDDRRRSSASPRGSSIPTTSSQLAPFTAALVGAGVGPAARAARRSCAASRRSALVARAWSTELVVLHAVPGQLELAAAPCCSPSARSTAVALVASAPRRPRAVALAAALAALLLAPASWAVETLGHATSGTFPAGGPASADGGRRRSAAAAGRGAVGARAAAPARLRRVPRRPVGAARRRRRRLRRRGGRRPRAAAGARRGHGLPPGARRAPAAAAGAARRGRLRRRRWRRPHAHRRSPTSSSTAAARSRVSSQSGAASAIIQRARTSPASAASPDARARSADVARPRGALGRDPLGAGRTGWNAEPQGPAGRHARGFESGDHGGREGLQEGDGLDGRGHRERGIGGRRRDERRDGHDCGQRLDVAV